MDAHMGKRKSPKSAARDFQVAKVESSQITLFIPSGGRFENPIDQRKWQRSALELLGKLFGGATALPQGQGVWRDDAQDGKLVFDATVVIQCYTNRTALQTHQDALRRFLVTMGTETNQGAIGLVIDQSYMEIPFPLRPQEHTHGQVD
jgi:hypothetical protein